MTCLTCANAEVLFFCRACRHGTCLDSYHDASNHCSCNSIYLCSTVPDADMPAPLGEHEREEITAEIDFTIPFAAESEGWHPDDRHVGRLHRLQEIKDLVLGGGSTGYAAMDRIVLEGVSKYHYTNHPTYRSRSIPSIAQHWDEQSDVAPYPIVRPSPLSSPASQLRRYQSYTSFQRQAAAIQGSRRDRSICCASSLPCQEHSPYHNPS